MVGLPAETPVTTPVDEPTVVSAVLLLLHVPPPVASLKVAELPTQTTPAPVIAAGAGLTVSSVQAIQPVGSV